MIRRGDHGPGAGDTLAGAGDTLPPAASDPGTDATLAPAAGTDATLAPAASDPGADATLAAPAPPSAGSRGSVGSGAPAAHLAGPATPGAPASGPAYALLGVLGSGAMGEVLLARDRDLRRRVAVKRMAPDVAASAQLTRRFFDEAEVTAQLDHPNIVPIYGLVPATDGKPGYAMKLVEGDTLASLLVEAARTAPGRSAREEAARLAAHLDCFLKVCEGVAFAHSRGVLHRDLKPANIMVGRHGEVYVMDWGLCRVLPCAAIDGARSATGSGERAAEREPDPAPAGVESPGDALHTRYGALLGTPAYMSPEQASGQNPLLDERSDVYALGLVLQEVVTLARAVTGDGASALLARARAAERNAVEHVDPRRRVAPELRAVIARATAPERDARYPSVTALADDVRRHLRGEAVAARRDTVAQAALRFVARHRAATLVGTLGVLLLAAGATIAIQRRAEARLADARHREQRLAEFLSATARQSHAIDNQLHRHEASLQHLAGLLRGALESPPPTSVEPYLAEDYDSPAHRPPDLARSAFYATDVSLGHVGIKLAPGVDRAAALDDLRRIEAATPAMRQLLVESRDAPADAPLDPARTRALLLDEGVPLVRVFVTLPSGIHAVYPGMGGFRAQYDGRRVVKYRLAESARGVRWGRPYVDRYRHLVLPASLAMRDDTGRLLGVTGFELTFQRLGDELLGVAGHPAVTESYLLDDHGEVVIRHVPAARRHPGDPWGDARDDLARAGDEGPRTVAHRVLPYPDAEAAVRERGAGWIELSAERRVAAFERVTALGWTYVVVADRDALLAR